MKRKSLLIMLATFLISSSLMSCSLVKLSGTMTKKTGEAMTEYSEENDGFIGKMTGFGGRVNTAVGTAVEDVAERDDSSKPKTERFTEANKTVIQSAVGAVSNTSNGTNGKIKSKHSSVNIRPTPSTANPPIGSMRGGDEITILEEKGDWLKIELVEGNYTEGWVYKYLAEGFEKN